MSHGQDSLEEDDMGAVWDPCYRETTRYTRGLDCGSYEPQSIFLVSQEDMPPIKDPQ